MELKDTYLREKLANKLANHETPAPDAIWMKVLSQTVAASHVGKTWTWSKIIAAASIAIGIIGVAIFIGLNADQPKNNSEHIVADSTSQQTAIPPQAIQPHEQPVQVEMPVLSNKEVKIVPDKPTVTPPEEIITFGPGVEHATKHDDTDEDTSNRERKTDSNASPTPPSEATPLNFSAIATDKNGLLFFFIPEITDAKSYQWNFGDGESSAEMSPSHEYADAGEYEVILAIEGEGGTNQMSKKIIALPAAILEVPSIFTPNNDGKNDLFDVSSLSKNIIIQRIAIYSQDGIRVYEGDGDHPWDGTDAQGNALPAGNYIYDISASDLRQRPVEKRGAIYLRR